MTNDQSTLGAKSLGEKLFIAEKAAEMRFYSWLDWSEYSGNFQSRYERVALAFVASLSQDEEKAALILRAQAAEAERDALREALREVRPIRHAAPVGRTLDEMQNNVRSTDLYEIGDALLIWVNYGDWLQAVAASEDAARALQTKGEGE
ncbi:hypothetical protein [Caulobacter phage KcrB]|nr:hypothetical protein RW_GP029 [Caulobacter phage RW]WCA46333.1 hypothetical protein [Caulobacter phage KcrB]WCD56268.1 hypothetical protein [Caulobacter phage RLK]WNV48060.1 hypothetical protein GB2A_gp028 [Caulobacter phage GB2A]